MQKWRPTPAFRVFTRQRRYPRSCSYRWFSSQHHVETVAVQCASSGSIQVNLYNVSQHDRSRPLVIYIPPFFQTGLSSPAPLPNFLSPYPSAVINYRWLDPSSNGNVGGDQSSIFQWPSPVHDTLFGYSWITENLAPPGDGRRDVYVYGSYLGASLAASLALTESHQDRQMAVRGFLTYNGIYNWTMFLPDHPLHRNKPLDETPSGPSYQEGSFFHYLRDKLSTLFSSPSGLFDPFASPSVFFQDPGLWIPDDFTSSVASSSMSQAIDALSCSSPSSEDTGSGSTASTMWNLKPPSKSYLTFPPWGSTLKIPEALLLYESPPPRAYRSRRPTQRKTAPKKKRVVSNNFEGQATELSNLMRRSIEKYELRDREEESENPAAAAVESHRRVQTRDVGAVEGDGQLGELGQDIAASWLKERIGL